MQTENLCPFATHLSLLHLHVCYGNLVHSSEYTGRLQCMWVRRERTILLLQPIHDTLINLSPFSLKLDQLENFTSVQKVIDLLYRPIS